MFPPAKVNRTQNTKLDAADWVIIGILLALVVAAGVVLRMVLAR